MPRPWQAICRREPVGRCFTHPDGTQSPLMQLRLWSIDDYLACNPASPPARRSWVPAISDRLREKPAVDSKINAGNETTGLFAGEENHGADEFRGVPETAHGRMAQNYLATGGSGSIFVKE